MTSWSSKAVNTFSKEAATLSRDPVSIWAWISFLLRKFMNSPGSLPPTVLSLDFSCQKSRAGHPHRSGVMDPLDPVTDNAGSFSPTLFLPLLSPLHPVTFAPLRDAFVLRDIL
jgi:hypothetical protein